MRGRRMTTKRKTVAPRVPRTRNDGTMTEAAFWSWVRSGLRKMSMRWRPIYGTLNNHKRLCTDEDRRKWGNRVKYVHQCMICKEWWPRKMVEVDHDPPCGSIKCFEDIGPFMERMLTERGPNLRPLCKPCHKEVTHG